MREGRPAQRASRAWAATISKGEPSFEPAIMSLTRSGVTLLGTPVPVAVTLVRIQVRRKSNSSHLLALGALANRSTTPGGGGGISRKRLMDGGTGAVPRRR